MTIFWRTWISVVLLGFIYVFGGSLNTLNTIALGKLATAQFEPSDQSYILYRSASAFLALLPSLISIGLMAGLVALWWEPVRKLVVKIATTYPALFLSVAWVFAAGIGPVYAYADKADLTEAYTILPNESAFWIPDTGDNKNNQAQLESIDYLNSRKLAVKRFVIPHAKLGGSGGFLA